ncbi:hypothetical protein U1Q18_041051, partial [Sarracenia purpurea var. burkii]
MTMRSKSQRLKEGMALREEMSRDGGSTGMTSSSSLVAKELDVVNVTLSLFEGQRSPTKLNNEVKVGETMNHPRVSSSPTGPSSSAKISQVFSEALRQDREDAEDSEEESEEDREVDEEELLYRQALIDKAMVEQRLESIQNMRSLRQKKGKGIASTQQEGRGLLGSNVYASSVNEETIRKAIRSKLSQQSIDTMSKEITEEEVRSVMWSLPANKAPGPD